MSPANIRAALDGIKTHILGGVFPFHGQSEGPPLPAIRFFQSYLGYDTRTIYPRKYSLSGIVTSTG